MRLTPSFVWGLLSLGLRAGLRACVFGFVWFSVIMCLRVDGFVYLHVFVCICICLGVSECVCMYVRLLIYICVYMYAFVCIRVVACICVHTIIWYSFHP